MMSFIKSFVLRIDCEGSDHFGREDDLKPDSRNPARKRAYILITKNVKKYNPGLLKKGKYSEISVTFLIHFQLMNVRYTF